MVDPKELTDWMRGEIIKYREQGIRDALGADTAQMIEDMGREIQRLREALAYYSDPAAKPGGQSRAEVAKAAEAYDE